MHSVPVVSPVTACKNQEHVEENVDNEEDENYSALQKELLALLHLNVNQTWSLQGDEVRGFVCDLLEKTYLKDIVAQLHCGRETH